MVQDFNTYLTSILLNWLLYNISHYISHILEYFYFIFWIYNKISSNLGRYLRTVKFDNIAPNLAVLCQIYSTKNWSLFIVLLHLTTSHLYFEVDWNKSFKDTNPGKCIVRILSPNEVSTSMTTIARKILVTKRVWSSVGIDDFKKNNTEDYSKSFFCWCKDR